MTAGPAIPIDIEAASRVLVAAAALWAAFEALRTWRRATAAGTGTGLRAWLGRMRRSNIRASLALGARLGAVLLAALGGCGLAVAGGRRSVEYRSVVILIDRSGSMDYPASGATSGHDFPPTRGQAVSDALDRADLWLGRLAGSADLAWASFGADVAPGQDAPCDPSRTRLDAALAWAAGRADPAAVVLFSDGTWNDGRTPLVAAEDLALLGAPIYAVVPGDEGAFPADTAVLGLRSPPTVRVGTRAEATADLLVTSPGEASVTVRLLVNGTVLDEEVVAVPAGTSRPSVRFEIPMEAEGDHAVSVAASMPGDERASNDSAETVIRAVQGGGGVLCLFDPPRWETRFIRRALAQIEGLPVMAAWVGPEGTLGDPGWDGPLANADAIVIGDLADKDLPAGVTAASLAEAVEHGTGLVLLGGRQTFQAGGMAHLLSARLPIAWTDSTYRAATPLVPREVFRDPEIPGLDGLAGIELHGSLRAAQPRAAANVLLAGEGGPAVVVGRSGLGRVAVVIPHDTWRVATAPEDGALRHGRFWRQIVLWASGGVRPGETLRIRLPRRRYLVGEEVRAEVLGRLDDYGLAVRASPDGPETPLAVEDRRDLDGGIAAGWISFPAGAPGRYEVVATPLSPPLPSPSGRGVGGEGEPFVVAPDERELPRPISIDVLRSIADASGGALFPLGDADRAFEEALARADPIVVTTPQTDPAWSHPGFVLLVLALACAAWALSTRG